MSRKIIYPKQFKGSAERSYYIEMSRTMDAIFLVAHKKGWDWWELATQAGVCGSTVRNLGMRYTKFPQLRTTMLMARAVGCTVEIVNKQGTRLKKSQAAWKERAIGG